MLKRLAAFYSVRVVSYTFMSNHYNSHQARTKRSTVASSRLKPSRPRNRLPKNLRKTEEVFQRLLIPAAA
jgi:hypothetical protein